MKTLELLINSFDTKAAQDAYALVSREDLLTAVTYLKKLLSTESESKVSLNSDMLANPFRDSL